MSQNQETISKRLYLFFTAAVTDVGGGQIYIRRKLIYLRQCGYTPIVFSFSYGKFYIDELKEFDACIIPELRYPISAFTKHHQDKIKKKIKTFFPLHTDSIVIESHEYVTASWGESLAKDVNGKHVVYLLSETPWLMPEEFKPFFLMKYKRNELFFITPAVAQSFMQNFMDIEEFNPENFALSARCGTSVENVAEDHLGIVYEKDAITICSIGRLEKPFVYPMCCDLLEYVKSKPEKKFVVIFVGGSKLKQNVKQIKTLFTNVKNCRIFITGFVYPIPESILQKSDICISSAGSVGMAARYGIPSISIDSVDYKPIGVMNFTTQNTLKRDKEEIRPLADWLQEILIDKKYPKNFHSQEMIEIDYADHLKVINDIDKLYFDVAQIKCPKRLIFKAWLLSVLKCKKLIFKIRSLYIKV